MLSALVVIVAIAFSSFCSYLKSRSLFHNIAEAKSSGFPYLVIPFSPFALPWTLAQPLLAPLLNSLPSSWTQPWLSYFPCRLSIRRVHWHTCFRFLQFNRSWHYGYKPFKEFGADTIMIVTPSGNILITCDPEAAGQLFRNKSLGKPAELMGILNVFGPTITGTDGQEARLYRKITSPFFNEETMYRVWEKSVSSAEALLHVIQGHNEELRPVLARMTLHLLNAVCFGCEQDCLDELQLRGHIPSGCKLSCSEAMAAMLEHLPTVFFTPSIVLSTCFNVIHWYQCTNFCKITRLYRFTDRPTTRTTNFRNTWSN